MNGVHMTTPSRRRGAPPAGKRLTRDAVIATATEVIERDGVGSFSLRSLAKELDVRPGALYNHVTGLHDLLDEVTARFLAGLELPEIDDQWPDWLRATATQLHDRMLARPELTGLLLSRAPAIPAGPALLRQFHDRLEASGVAAPTAHLAWHTILTVVIGSVQQERARNRSGTETFEAVLDITLTGLVSAAANGPDERTRALHDRHTRT